MKTKIELSKIRKKARADGKAFEVKVRDYLTKQGFICVRWDKNVEFFIEKTFPDNCAVCIEKKGKLVNSKPKFNPFTKSLMMNSGGFPDFLIFKRNYEVDASELSGRIQKDMIVTGNAEVFVTEKEIKRLFEIAKEVLIKPKFDIKLVECKSGRGLDKLEKEKAKWITDNLKIPVFIAQPGIKRGEIILEEFK